MKSSIIIFLLICSGCSTLPSGKGVLKNEYKKSQFFPEKSKLTTKGRPIYIKAIRYPSVTKEGHIIGKSIEYIKIGHETVSLEDVISKLQEKSNDK